MTPLITRPIDPSQSAAVFQRGKLWSVGDTIHVSFLNPDYKGLEWEYSLDEVSALVPAAEMKIEQDARAAAETSYADAFKLVIQTKVVPVVPTLNIQFVDSGGDVVVQFMAGGGSSSTIGTDCKLHEGDYTLTLGWLDVGTMIHEFSHALGMLHEHQNPNAKINWNRDAVIAYYQSTQSPPWSVQQIEDNILNPVDPATVFASTFDPQSVMLYFFSPDLTNDGVGTKANLRYSSTDIQWLQKMYDVQSSSTAVVASSSKSSGVSIWIILAAFVLVLLVLFFMLR